MKVIILGSGNGTNAQAILDAFAKGQLGLAQPIGIISDQPDAPILKRGEAVNVPGYYLDPGAFKTRLSPEAEQNYIDFIQQQKPDNIVLAGFMRVLKSPLLNAFSDKIINLHPSLLPSFKGLDAIKQAFDYGVKVTGCTVHWVTPEVDAGPIIDQEIVRVEAEDTLESLTEKVHQAEYKLLPRVIAELSFKND